MPDHLYASASIASILMAAQKHFKKRKQDPPITISITVRPPSRGTYHEQELVDDFYVESECNCLYMSEIIDAWLTGSS